MTILQLIKNFFTEDGDLSFGLAHSGSVNIESGFAEVKSHHFPDCADCAQSIDLVRECNSCGRRKGNNFQFMAGRGDGVYSGISFYDDGLALMGCIYVFDEDNRFALATSSQLTGETLRGNTFQDDLIETLKDYLECEASVGATIQATSLTTRDVGFIVGDSQASKGSQFATVDHPFANGEYKVYLFTEPILASPPVQFAISLGEKASDYDTGYTEARRPRALFVVHENFDSKAMKMIRPQNIDWEKQAQVWSRTLVASNISGNAGRANLFNGLTWISAANDQESFISSNSENEQIWYLYATRAFGYFIQAALCGEESGLEMALDQVKASQNGDILSEEVLKDAIEPRGLSNRQEVLSLFGVAESADAVASGAARFCQNCGERFGAGANFCQSCGTKR